MQFIFNKFLTYLLIIICIKGCSTFIMGGGRYTYKVDIDASEIDKSGYLASHISDILLNRGYEQCGPDKPVSPPDFPGQSGFISSFKKIVTSEGYPVCVYVKYAQSQPLISKNKLHIWVVNWTAGNRIPELIFEINEVSNAIYSVLVDDLGKNNVTITKHSAKNNVSK